MNTTVDTYVETRIAPEQQEIVAALRALMREYAPNSVEQVSYDMQVWTVKRIFAYLNSGKQGITLSFVRGVQFEDPYDLLRGRGKGARYIKFKKLSEIDLYRDALRSYIQQALALDAE